MTFKLPRFKKPKLVIGLVIALLLAGAGAITTYVLYSNQPVDHKALLAEAVIKDFQAQTVATRATIEMTLSKQLGGAHVTVDAKGQSTRSSGYFNATFTVDLGVMTFNLKGKLAYSHTDYYIQLDDPRALAKMLGTSPEGPTYFQQLADDLEGKWLMITPQDVEGVGLDKTLSCLAAYTQADLNKNDADALRKLITDHGYVNIKEVLPDGKIRGKDSYHISTDYDRSKEGSFYEAAGNLISFAAAKESCTDITPQPQPVAADTPSLFVGEPTISEEFWINKQTGELARSKQNISTPDGSAISIDQEIIYNLSQQYSIPGGSEVVPLSEIIEWFKSIESGDPLPIDLSSI